MTRKASRPRRSAARSRVKAVREPERRPWVGRGTLGVFACCVIGLSVLISLKAIPEYLKLEEMEEAYHAQLLVEKKTAEQCRQLELENSSLKTNFAYAEARARSVLFRYKEGEDVVLLD